MKIELTARCDFNCFFCATAKRLRRKADIEAEFFRRIVREMREAGVEELGVFYLGESFLCPWLARGDPLCQTGLWISLRVSDDQRQTGDARPRGRLHGRRGSIASNSVSTTPMPSSSRP